MPPALLSVAYLETPNISPHALIDKFFSLYIRLRSSNEYGMVQCFTCGKVAHYKTGGMQNGHFQSRRFMATRYSEDGNCEVQCVACNMFRGGEQYKFALGLDSKYGEGTAEELEYHNNYGSGLKENNFFDWLMIIPINLSVATSGYFAALETKGNASILRAYKVVLDDMLEEVVDKIDKLEPEND